MTILGKVNLIIRLRINSDGKGVRSVIFLQDYPLSCVWCHNPETRFGNRYKEVMAEQLYELVARDQIYFDATRVERCKCDALKGIRKAFCEINSVPLSIKECSFKGRCVGICPKCEEKLL